MERSEHLRLLKEDLGEATVFYRNQQYSYILPTLKSLWARANHSDLSESPIALECGLKLASCYYQLGDFIEAQRTLSAIKQRCKTDDPEVLLCEIFALNDFGEFESASVLAGELEAKFKELEGEEKDLQYESKTAHREKFATSLIESGQADEALAVLGSILRTKNNRCSSLKLKAKALIKLQDWKAASVALRRLEELENPVSDATKELAAVVRVNLGGPATLENDAQPTVLEKNIASIQGRDI